MQYRRQRTGLDSDAIPRRRRSGLVRDNQTDLDCGLVGPVRCGVDLLKTSTGRVMRREVRVLDGRPRSGSRRRTWVTRARFGASPSRYASAMLKGPLKFT